MKVVLATGVGALIGQGILQGLQGYDRHKLTILGMDLNACTHAKHLCHQFIQKPAISEGHPDYLQFWTQLVDHHQIDLILPGIEIDVVFLARMRADHVSLPALINSQAVLEMGLDKYRLYQFALEHKIKAIPTVLASDQAAVDDMLRESNQYILKPRCSNGSRGLYPFQSAHDLSVFLEEQINLDRSQYIVQPCVGSDDEEYTASIFGFGNGCYQGPIVFRRILSKEGYTRYAQTVDPPEDVLSSIETITSQAPPLGPTNLQFRQQKGDCLLMEINPRFSSTTSLKAAFGFDETAMALDFSFDQITDTPLKLLKGEGYRFTADYIRYL